MMNRVKQWVHAEEKDLAEMIAYWAPKIGVADWLIEAVVVNPDDMSSTYVDGRVIWYTTRRMAQIMVCSPDVISRNIPHDTEMILVHEMLHVAFCHASDQLVEANVTKTEEAVMIEQPIDQIAQTLVLLRRNAGGKSKHRFSFEKGKK